MSQEQQNEAEVPDCFKWALKYLSKDEIEKIAARVYGDAFSKWKTQE